MSEVTRYVIMTRDGYPSPNVLEISEEWAWIVYLRLKVMPSKLTKKHRENIEHCKEHGIRAVRVALQEPQP